MKQLLAAILITVLLTAGLLPVTSYGETGDDNGDDFKLYAQSAVLIDAASGRVLYGKNEDEQRPMASTTKIMTCILALEMGNLSDVVTVSTNAASQPKVHLGMRKGQEFYLKDLLYSLMLESHNDSAVAIAEHIGGSVEGFAALMNQKARDLGCNDTYFITPNGLDAQEPDETGSRTHSTTAKDLARIMRYCIMESEKKDEFLEITGTQNYYFTDRQKKQSFNCTNHNALLTMRNDVISGKTGFTGGAGYSYVGAAESEGRTYIIALLGCGWPPHKTWKWSDAAVLLRYGMENYHYRDVFEAVTLKHILVEGAQPLTEDGDIEEPVYTELSLNLTEQESTLPYLLSDTEKVHISYQLPKALKAPVHKGDLIGSIKYSLNQTVIKAYPVYACNDIERLDFSWCMRKILIKYLPWKGTGDILSDDRAGL